jgi:ubiquitin-conjugating enzyme E2 H
LVLVSIKVTQRCTDDLLEYVAKYASKDLAEDSDKDDDDNDEMSSVGSYESGDEEEAPGNMEDI